MEFDHETISEAFENKRLVQRCPACARSEWEIGAVFVMPLLQQPGGEPATAKQTGGDLTMQGAPVTPRVCATCGYMQLFFVPTLLRH